MNIFKRTSPKISEKSEDSRKSPKTLQKLMTLKNNCQKPKNSFYDQKIIEQNRKNKNLKADRPNSNFRRDSTRKFAFGSQAEQGHFPKSEKPNILSQTNNNFVKSKTLLSNNFNRKSTNPRSDAEACGRAVGVKKAASQSLQLNPWTPKNTSTNDFFEHHDKMFHSAQTKRFNSFKLMSNAPLRLKQSKSLWANFKLIQLDLGNRRLKTSIELQCDEAAITRFSELKGKMQHSACKWADKIFRSKMKTYAYQFFLKMQREERKDDRRHKKQDRSESKRFIMGKANKARI